MKNDKVAILLKKASLEFDKVANTIYGEYDLTSSQYKVLKYLYTKDNKTARVVDLEKEFSMTHPTTLGLIAQLEKKGFTKRVDNPSDGRGKLVALTKKSESLQKELELLGNDVEKQLTNSLNKKEKEELIYLLRKLMDMPL